MEKFRIAVFADKEVGEFAVRYLLDNYPSHISCICVTEDDTDISRLVNENNDKTIRLLRSNDLKDGNVKELLRSERLDHIILAWWPYILKKDLIDIPQKGVINFHPAMLPYNAGKDSNFWSIVEECPYGVSLMFIDEGIDSGDIIFQKQIDKSWEDTGESLYRKGLEAMKELFVECYPRIVKGDYIRKKNNRSEGSFHYRKEMLEAVKLDLDREYILRDILNLLRAKTFKPYTGCWFEDHGRNYEVSIEIKEIVE